MKKINIIVDSREPQKMKERILMDDFFYPDPTFPALEAGDYIIGKTLIERKTISDLWGSIRDKRIFKQAKKLVKAKEKGFNPVLLVEGTYLHNRRYKQLYGIIFKIKHEYGIEIEYSSSKDQTLDFFKKRILMESGEYEISYDSIREKGISKKSNSEKQIFVLEGFSRVGTKTAIKMLKEGKTLKGVLQMIVEDGMYEGAYMYSEYSSSDHYKGKTKEINQEILEHSFDELELKT